MKIIIIGGSIGGLHAGIALMDQGFDVEIYERSEDNLQGRGAGLVIQPDMMDYLMAQNIMPKAVFGIPASKRQILNDQGHATLTYPNDTIFTSWNYLWQQLKAYFPKEKYHFGFALENLEQSADMVTATFKNGAIRTAALVIGADGYHSVVRKYIVPDVHPRYAGYVAWRGLIPEPELNSDEVAFFADKFSLYPYQNSHMLSYLVPGPNGELSKGKRLLNWVWYLNKTTQELSRLMTDKAGRQHEFTIPAGSVSNESIKELQQNAALSLPPILAERVIQTSEPFIQVIFDLAVTRMYNNRIAIIGDAAFVVRPHTASGTAKAFRDSISLASLLKKINDPAIALAHWNEQQISQAENLVYYGKQLASRSQLGN